MTIRNKITKYCFYLASTLILCFVSSFAFALPFTLTPTATLPTTIVKDETLSVTYTVTNNTTTTRTGNYVKYLPTNVTNAGTGTCGSGTFDLASGASCTLTLTISGAVDLADPDPRKHLYVCFQGGVTCAGPSVANQLNIAQITVSSIAVTPETATVVNGKTQQFTATATYSDGSTADVTSSSFTTWLSSNGTVALVGTSTGLATAQADSGTANITATHHSVVSNEAVLTASEKYIEAPITIKTSAGTTADIDKLPGTTDDFTVEASYTNGDPANIPTLYSWNTSTSSTATVTPGASVAVVAIQSSPSDTAVNTVIKASVTTPEGTIESNEITVTVPEVNAITISPDPADPIVVGLTGSNTRSFTASATYNTTGSPTQDVTTSSLNIWASSAESVATIVNNTGVATAVANGTTNITATIGTISDSVALNVFPNMAATGNYDNSSTDAPIGFRSINGGIDWTLISPTAEGSGNNYLSTAACSTNGNTCITAGQYDNTAFEPYTYTSDDYLVSWNSVVKPSAPGNISNDSKGVSCNSTAANCLLVGYYNNGGNDEAFAFNTSNSGSTWTDKSSFLPTLANGGQLHATFCEKAQSDLASMRCIGIGQYTDGSANTQPLSILTITGGNSWIDDSPTASGGVNSTMTAIACDDTADKCTMVGYDNSAATFTPKAFFAENISNSALNFAVSTMPTVPSSGAGNSYKLNSVSCNSTGVRCIAVGDYEDTSSGTRHNPLVYVTADGGETWGKGTLPALTAEDMYLTSIKCYDGIRRCIIMGYKNTSPQAPIAYYTDDINTFTLATPASSATTTITWNPVDTPPPVQSGNTHVNALG